MRWVVLFGGLALLAAPGIGVGQDARTPVQQVSGSDTYRTYCATCHGEKARGDGPLAESLRFRPPDLTQLASRNDGTFPTTKVIRIVDGRDPVGGHGGPDMPVWGDAFKNTESGLDDDEVNRKIQAVVAHLEKLQEK
jgi:mono/diheme cytochrome c family protein